MLKAVPHLTDLTPSSSSSAPPPQTLSIMLVKMAGCRSITLVTMTRRIIIQECLDCTLIVCTTTTMPVLRISCHKIVFMPFNTNYSGIKRIQTGLKKKSLNQWSNPIVMVPSSREVFFLLNPSKFDTFYLPFSIYLANPFIPMAVRRKKHLLEDWGKTVACLTSQEDDFLKSLVKKELNVYLESFSLQTGDEAFSRVDK